MSIKLRKANILVVASELTPLAKVGGLGDVIGALPKSLNRYVHKITVALPFHEALHQHRLPKLTLVTRLTVKFANQINDVAVWQTTVPNSTIPLLLFDNTLYLSRGDIYCGRRVWNPFTQHWSNLPTSIIVKYAFFSQAIVELVRQLPKTYNLIHLNDWLTAPVASELLTLPVANQPKTLFTLHNPGHSLDLTADLLAIYPKHTQHALLNDVVSYRQRNPLTRLGIRYSTKINVVSPGYLEELRSPRYGRDLAALLQKRKNDVVGILNGIDTELFNPKTDPALHYHFSSNKQLLRARNKAHLQRLGHFKVNQRIPLLGIVSRIESQKGFGLLLRLIPQLSKLGAQCLINGTGHTPYEKHLKRLAEKFPQQFMFHNSFDVSFAHQIYGGADIFLMPSLYEPCGLAQLIAMRYGCVPIVRAVGGLKDTVHDGYNGFTFKAYSIQALKQAVQRAITIYHHQPKQWRALIQNGLTGSYDWDRSAKTYAILYQKILDTAS